jgi:hypothetical protein
MGIFTSHAAKRCDERIDINPARLAQLMKSQGLAFEPGKDVRVPGVGTLIIDKNGKCTTVLSDDMAYVQRARH